jgi:hypothetical protein
MRIIRFALAFALILAIGWFAFAVKVGHRSIAGHVGRWVERIVASRHPTVKHEQARPLANPAVRADPTVQREATKKRVELLESAARAAATEDDDDVRAQRNTAPRTRTDEHLSPDHKKALDDLVTSRVTRSR